MPWDVTGQDVEGVGEDRWVYAEHSTVKAAKDWGH